MDKPKPTAQQRTEQVLDGLTRAKQAVIILKRLGCSILQVDVGGKNPKLIIQPPVKPIDGLQGETRLSWLGAGGRELVTYVALFGGCRIEWTQPKGGI